MPEATTETATNPTEAAPSSEAVVTNLLAPAVTTETPTTQPTTETATETPAAETKTEEAKVIEGAPEKYEFKAPEGKEFDKGLLEGFEAAARESNLTQEAAQKMIDQMAPKIQARQAEQVAAIRQEWFEKSSADKEFGGDRLQENLGVAKAALTQFGSPELTALLDATGLCNHPEVIRMLHKVGKATSEDKVVVGGAVDSTSSAKSLYPNSNMN